MNKRIIILLSFSVFLNSIFLIFLYFTSETKSKSKYQAEQLLQITLNSFNTLSFYNVAFSEELEKSKKKISILEESIHPKDKRWAKIKIVRSVFQGEIKTYNLVPNLTIDDVTLIASAVVDYSELYDVPISLIAAIIRAESSYDPLAFSASGAEGLMQLMPSTAEEVAFEIGKRAYSVHKITDNIQLGTYYLWKMLKRFKGDQELAIRAYNCGPQYVEKVLANIYSDYPDETKKYLENVLMRKKIFEDAGL